MSGSEFETIAKIAKWVPAFSSRVEVGIGDDAAVLRAPAGKLLATVDMMVEGVHFERAYSRAEEIGHKLLAINMSDLAAMGGVARYGLVSLALPAGTEERFLEALYRGMRELAERHGVDIVGGNLTTTSGPLTLDLTLLGDTEKPVLRSGARPGDKVAVTGALGGAAAGLAALRKWGEGARDQYATLVRRQLTPEPRLREAQLLAPFATAMIDISDGLASELHHLAKRSQCGFRIRREALPIEPGVAVVARALGAEAADWVMAGGEDYELLFTFAESDRARLAAAVPITVIGEVTGGGLRLEEADGTVRNLGDRGWRHHW